MNLLKRMISKEFLVWSSFEFCQLQRQLITSFCQHSISTLKVLSMERLNLYQHLSIVLSPTLGSSQHHYFRAGALTIQSRNSVAVTILVLQMTS